MKQLRYYILAIGTLLASICSANAASKASLQIFTDSAQQTVKGIGGNIVYYEEWVTESPVKEAIYDTLFDGLGISVLRMANWWNVNNDRIPDQVEIFKEAKKHCGQNLPVVMAAWTCPADLKACQDLNGTNSTGKSTLKKDKNNNYVYSDYAKWWREAYEHYSSLGMAPEYVSIQNEPDMDSPDYFTMVFKPTPTNEYAGYNMALTYTYNEMSKMSKCPLFMGADNMGIGWHQTQDYINALDNNLLSAYSFHYYHSGSESYKDLNSRYAHPEEFLPAMKELAKQYYGKKDLWMTENSPLRDITDDDAIYTAEYLAYGFKYNKISYYIYWNLLWGDKENAIINIENDESTVKTKQGFTVSSLYHGLRHFSKFVRPGMAVIKDTCSTSDIISTSFCDPEKDSCTIVLINKSANDYTMSLNTQFCGTYKTDVILTQPSKKIWSQDLGALQNNSVSVPAYSIVTVTYRRVPGKMIYICDESAGGSWEDTSYWVSKYLPNFDDTTIIRKGEARLPYTLNHTAPCYVESGAILRPTSSIKVDFDIILQGGTLRTYTSNQQFVLTAPHIYVENASTIKAGSKFVTKFDVEAPFIGSANMTKAGDQTVRLMADNSQYSGRWEVKLGTLGIGQKYALGTTGAIVDSAATLQIQTEAETEAIKVNKNGTLSLDYPLTVYRATIGDSILPGGVYYAKDFPEYITGTSKLIVHNTSPLINKLEGTISQNVYVGDSIKTCVYEVQFADSISVYWVKDVPDSISLTADSTGTIITVSGMANKVGTYAYEIFGYNHHSGATYTRRGSITSTIHLDTVKVTLESELASQVNYIGDSIKSVKYGIAYADSINIYWMPKQPAGIVIELDSTKSHATVSGKIMEEGDFTYFIDAFNSTSATKSSKYGILTGMKPVPEIKIDGSLTQNSYIYDTIIPTKVSLIRTDEISYHWINQEPDSLSIETSEDMTSMTITGAIKKRGTYKLVIEAYNATADTTVSDTCIYKVKDIPFYLTNNGDILQTIDAGDVIDDIIITAIGADSVSVRWDWNRVPESVDMSVNNNEVTIRGGLWKPGNYSFVVTAKNNLMDSTITMQGIIQANTVCPVISSNTPISYSMTQGDTVSDIVFDLLKADSAVVEWTPYRPDSVNVDIDIENETITINGQMNDAGSFSFMLYAYNTISETQSYFKSQTFNINSTTKSDDVRNSLTYSGIRVWPNPIEDQMYVEMNAACDCTGTITLSNCDGAKVWSEPITMSKGLNQYSFDASKLASGIYLLSIQTEYGNNLHTKVIVK